MEIVQAIRTALSDRIGRERFDLWFGDRIQFVAIDGTLHIESDQPFTLDRVRRNHAADLQAVCELVFGKPTAIMFQVADAQDSSEPISNGPAPTMPVADGRLAGGGQADHGKSNAVGTRNKSASPRLRVHDGHRGRRFARLESFVVSNTNRVAMTAAQMLLEQGERLSPLFIHGGPGTGKTHLLEGIYSAARRDGTSRRAVFLSAEQFTNYFLEALRGSGLPSFRRRYRDVDLLLIDDVHFFAGKRSTLVELQHTIDNLLREGRQLVLAADRAPRELAGLGGELVNRMSGGLVCRIESHDYITRLDILRSMAAERGFSVPREVLEQMARELTGDARLLSGALNRLHATSVASGQPISIGLADLALDELFRTAKPLVRLPDIDQAVCDVFGLEPNTLQSNSRSKWISQPRMLAMWLARRYTRAAFAEIGEYFGRRSHSTVVSAQQKVDRWMNDGAEVQGTVGGWRVEEAVRRIESKLGTG